MVPFGVRGQFSSGTIVLEPTPMMWPYPESCFFFRFLRSWICDTGLTLDKKWQKLFFFRVNLSWILRHERKSRIKWSIFLWYLSLLYYFSSTREPTAALNRENFPVYNLFHLKQLQEYFELPETVPWYHFVLPLVFF